MGVDCVGDGPATVAGKRGGGRSRGSEYVALGGVETVDLEGCHDRAM